MGDSPPLRHTGMGFKRKATIASTARSGFRDNFCSPSANGFVTASEPAAAASSVASGCLRPSVPLSAASRELLFRAYKRHR